MEIEGIPHVVVRLARRRLPCVVGWTDGETTRPERATRYNGYGSEPYGPYRCLVHMKPEEVERGEPLALETVAERLAAIGERVRMPTIRERWQALPPGVREACMRYRGWRACRACGGRGLTGHLTRDEYREVRCTACGGACRESIRTIHAASVREAERILAEHGSHAEAESAARNLNPSPLDEVEVWRESWDGALTSAWLAMGRIDEPQAERIRARCRHRHECTAYDDLLDAGHTRDDAREMIGG